MNLARASLFVASAKKCHSACVIVVAASTLVGPFVPKLLRLVTFEAVTMPLSKLVSLVSWGVAKSHPLGHRLVLSVAMNLARASLFVASAKKCHSACVIVVAASTL